VVNCDISNSECSELLGYVSGVSDAVVMCY